MEIIKRHWKVVNYYGRLFIAFLSILGIVGFAVWGALTLIDKVIESLDVEVTSPLSPSPGISRPPVILKQEDGYEVRLYPNGGITILRGGNTVKDWDILILRDSSLTLESPPTPR